MNRILPFAFALGLVTLGVGRALGADSAEALYNAHCSNCHSRALRGSAHGSPLVGRSFLAKWGDKSRADLARYTAANMPPGGARQLNEGDYAAIVNFVIERNAAVADGTYALLSDQGNDADGQTGDAALESWSDSAAIDAAARAKGGFENRQIRDLSPVTDAMLRSPPDSDWLSWRRTLDGQGFSPLKQINRDTVGNLRLVWSLAMADGSNQGTPLVHEGVMFLTHPNNSIQAIEAATGEIIWEYNYDYPEDSRLLGGPTRNIAIYQDKLFLSTYDAAIVAIDIYTGEQLWRTVKADYREAYTHSSGPIVGAGVVLSGINGCELYTKDGCFLTGHDPDTGKELWRTSTIAYSGEPGGDTWGDQPDELRAGGDSWIAGSFDPQLNLFLIGTSQPKPWVAASRGMSPLDKALYTNSTLAVDPATGKVVWAFQHVPGETIDMEVGFERVLVDVDDSRYVLTIGKDGILWKLNRETGEFVDFVETLPQNVFVTLDKQTGTVTYRQDIIDAAVNETVSACPGIYGGHNWQASAFYPPARTLVIPLHQTCTDMVGREVERALGGGGYGGDSASYAMPEQNDNLARLSAYDVDTLQPLWSIQQRAMFLTGAVTTGGGLVFIGDLDRYFKAFDVTTGDLLWSIRLGAPLHGYPISYSVDGKQYIAVQSGIGVFRALTASLAPEIYQPTTGQAIYVFALPE